MLVVTDMTALSALDDAEIVTTGFPPFFFPFYLLLLFLLIAVFFFCFFAFLGMRT